MIKITTGNGHLTTTEKALRALIRATAGLSDRPTLAQILWDNQHIGGQLVATNGHYLLSVDVDCAPPHGVPVLLCPREIRKALTAKLTEIRITPTGAVDYPQWRALPVKLVDHPFKLGKLTNATRDKKQPAIIHRGQCRYRGRTGATLSAHVDWDGDRCDLDTAYLAKILSYLGESEVHITRTLDPVVIQSDRGMALLMPLRVN